MYSDDVYRAKLRATIADLQQAVAPLAPFTAIDVDLSGQGARFTLIPHTRGACPVELMVRADQHYDIALGQAIFEDCRVEQLDVFKPLILAVADGHIVRRHHISAQTGVEMGFETIVTMPSAQPWRKVHGGEVWLGRGGEVFMRDQRFLPYRR